MITYYGKEIIDTITLIIKPYYMDIYLDEGVTEVLFNNVDPVILVNVLPIHLIYRTDEEILKWIKNMLVFQ